MSTSILVVADESLVIPPDELAYCTVCHGVQLMGNSNINAPRLSGMDTWYVKQQLHSFKNGWRGTHDADLVGMEMRPMATALSDQQIISAAEFVNATRSPQPLVTIEGDAVAGKVLYSSCAACHGAKAEGNQSLGAPALAELNDWYLLTQLENYGDSVRGSAPQDNYGRQMRASAQVLVNNQSMQDVVKYITTLRSN